MRRFRLEKAAQQPFLTLFGHLAPGVGGRTPEGAVALLLRRPGRRIQADQEEGAVLVVASAARRLGQKLPQADERMTAQDAVPGFLEKLAPQGLQSRFPWLQPAARDLQPIARLDRNRPVSTAAIRQRLCPR